MLASQSLRWPAAFLHHGGCGLRSRALGRSLLFDSDASRRWAPAADFHHELDRIAPASGGEFVAVSPMDWARSPQSSGSRPPNRNFFSPRGWNAAAQQSAEIERKELDAALGALSLPDSKKETIAASFASARQAIAVLNTSSGEQVIGKHAPQGPIALDLPDVPGLSPQFAEHLKALSDYYGGRPRSARARWVALLDLPEAQRRERTVWAAYMIGESWLDECVTIDSKGPESDRSEAAEQGVQWFGRCRDLARAGFPDPLGLAASSLRQEARAEFARHRWPEGVHLMLQARATHDVTADEALQVWAKSMFDQFPSTPELAGSLAKSPETARVLTAFVNAYGGRLGPRPSEMQVLAWLYAVEATRAGTDAPAEPGKIGSQIGPDRLLLACYQYAAPASVRDTWAARCRAEPLAEWVKAKIEYVAAGGNIAKVMAHLRAAVAAFPPDEQWNEVRGGVEWATLRPRERAMGELGAGADVGQPVRRCPRRSRRRWMG